MVHLSLQVLVYCSMPECRYLNAWAIQIFSGLCVKINFKIPKVELAPLVKKQEIWTRRGHFVYALLRDASDGMAKWDLTCFTQGKIFQQLGHRSRSQWPRGLRHKMSSPRLNAGVVGSNPT
jgi:hypothetical protein